MTRLPTVRLPVVRMISIALFAALLGVAMAAFLTPVAAGAPTGPYFGTNVRVVRPPAYTGNSPSLALGTDNVAYLVFAGSGGVTTGSDIFFTKSIDEGRTWTLPIRVNNDAGAAIQADPSLAVAGPNNDLYIVWTDNRNGNEDVFFSRSTDHGLSFSANVRVNDVTTVFQREADVAVDPVNPTLVHAMWTDNRNQFTTGPDMYYANSTDGGLSFNPSIRVNTDSTGTEQTQAAIAVAPDRTVHAVWSDPRAAARGRDIFFSKSTDRGTSWTPEIILNDDSGNVAQVEPTIAVDDGGSVYVAWTDYRNTNTAPDIYATRSTNAGASFAANVQVNDDGSQTPQSQPSLAAIPGRVQIAWSDWRTGGSTSYDIYTASSANGLSWGANMAVTTEAPSSWQNSPSIGLDALGDVYAAWFDTRASGQDVYAAQLDIVAPTANAGSAATIDLGTEVVLDGSASADNRGIVGYEWDFDDGQTATGATVRHTYAAPGTYNVTLTVRDGSGNVNASFVQVTVNAPSPTVGDLLGQIRYLQVIVGALAVALAILGWLFFTMRRKDRGRPDARSPPPPREADTLDLPPPPQNP